MGSEPSAYKKLTGRRKRFVDFLCGVSRGNKADAARRAGYADPGSEGCRIYRDPDVKAAVRELLAENLATPEEILAELDLIRQNPLTQFYEEVTSQRQAPELPTEEELIRRAERGEVLEAVAAEVGAEEERVDGFRPGEWALNLRAVQAAGLMHLVKKIGRDKFGAQVVEFQDPEKARELLGKYHRLFTDRVEHTGPGGGPMVYREVVIELPRESDADETDPAPPGDPLED